MYRFFPEVDVVLVAAANAALAPLTRLAVENSKHVLVEKSGAIRSEDLNEIAQIAERTGARIRIGYNHRFHPAFRKAYELVQETDPKLSGGGELIDQGVHLIDLAASFMGEFTAVEAHAKTYFRLWMTTRFSVCALQRDRLLGSTRAAPNGRTCSRSRFILSARSC